MSLAFPEYLGAVQHRTNQQLDLLLPQAGQDSSRLVDAMRYSAMLGGKRIRPLLVFASSQAVDNQNPLQSPTSTAADICACAIECLHAYSLIHDDLPAMDNDDLRRGQPTCHRAFDEATAILAGDALQSFAFELLSQMEGLQASTQLALVRCLAEAAGAKGMVLGQAIDLQAVNQTLTLDALAQMHRYKTGALIRASVIMGALLTESVDEHQLQALTAYAEAVGLAFQVQDDILDVTSSTEQLGKQQGADVTRNKPTYVSLLGLNQARATAQNLHQQALQALQPFGDSADRLRQLSAYIIERVF